MKSFKISSIFGLLTVLALIALLVALLLPRASAQPYFTNSSPQVNGPSQYNDAFTPPLQPSKVLAAQYQAGTLAGTIAGGAAMAYASGIYTFSNNFSTNIFSAAPVVLYCVVGAGTNAIASSTVTTSNFVFTTTGTNGATFNWEATGH